MTFTIPTHQDRTFTDPAITVVKTVDDPINETFTPHVVISDDTGEYYHTLHGHPYVNGTWTDEDVQNSVTIYFQSISS